VSGVSPSSACNTLPTLASSFPVLPLHDLLRSEDVKAGRSPFLRETCQERRVSGRIGGDAVTTDVEYAPRRQCSNNDLPGFYQHRREPHAHGEDPIEVAQRDLLAGDSVQCGQGRATAHRPLGRRPLPRYQRRAALAARP
jgi:hypothetical protein